jgi:predicted nucleotidyltransferase
MTERRVAHEVRSAVAAVRSRLRGDPRLVLLCGSHAEGRASPSSDVDVIVVCDTSGIDRLRVMQNGVVVDVFRESLQSLREVLTRHHREHIVSMLADAVALQDSDGLADDLRAAARDALTRPPMTHTPARRFSVQERLRDAAQELSRPCGEKPQAVLLMCTAIDALIDAILVKHGLWTVKRRALLTVLERVAPEAAADLVTVTLATDLTAAAAVLAKYVDQRSSVRQKY